MKRTWTDQELQKYLPESFSYTELQNKLGLEDTKVSKTVFNRIKELGLNTNHFQVNYYGTRYIGRKFTLEDLKEGTKRLNSSSLRRLVLKTGLLKYECYSCGLKPFWNNKQLTLQIDHINGINTDNRLENLRILCPNCHSQTASFCKGGKRRTRKTINLCLICNIQITLNSKHCRDHANTGKRKVDWPGNLKDLVNMYGVRKVAGDLNVCRARIYQKIKSLSKDKQ